VSLAQYGVLYRKIKTESRNNIFGGHEREIVVDGEHLWSVGFAPRSV